jgi:hypothetical protein
MSLYGGYTKKPRKNNNIFSLKIVAHFSLIFFACIEGFSIIHTLLFARAMENDIVVLFRLLFLLIISYYLLKEFSIKNKYYYLKISIYFVISCATGVLYFSNTLNSSFFQIMALPYHSILIMVNDYLRREEVTFFMQEIPLLIIISFAYLIMFYLLNRVSLKNEENDNKISEINIEKNKPIFVVVGFIFCIIFFIISAKNNSKITIGYSEQKIYHSKSLSTRYGDFNIINGKKLHFNGGAFRPEIEAQFDLNIIKAYKIGNRDLVVLERQETRVCPFRYHIVSISPLGTNDSDETGVCQKVNFIKIADGKLYLIFIDQLEKNKIKIVHSDGNSLVEMWCEKDECKDIPKAIKDILPKRIESAEEKKPLSLKSMRETNEYKMAYSCAMEAFESGSSGVASYCVGNSRDPTEIEDEAYKDAERDFTGKNSKNSKK